MWFANRTENFLKMLFKRSGVVRFKSENDVLASGLALHPDFQANPMPQTR